MTALPVIAATVCWVACAYLTWRWRREALEARREAQAFMEGGRAEYEAARQERQSAIAQLQEWRRT